jgi:two-component system LytT family response regulator
MNAIFQNDAVQNNQLHLLRERTSLKITDIILLEAKINYTNIYLINGKKIIIAKTLKAFEDILTKHNFYRIHRTFLINRIHLKAYDSDLGEVLLSQNLKAVASRRRKICFEVQINKNTI